MKKIMLLFCLIVMSSTSSFAIVNFTTSTGALIMRDVVVDDNTVYDSVTLQLNLANGTFTILDATLKDTTFPNTPINTFSQNGLKIDFYGCALSGKNQITCMTKIVALNQNILAAASGSSGNGSKLFDDLSKEYEASTVTALDQANSFELQFNLIQGIPVEVKFIFNNIDPRATSISLFNPLFWVFNSGWIQIPATFNDIDF